MRLALTLAGLAVTWAFSSAAAQPPTRICNGMPVQLINIRLSGPGGTYSLPGGGLRRGQCRLAPSVPPGAYRLVFIEHGDGSAASCSRAVILPSKRPITLRPGDGAACLY